MIGTFRLWRGLGIRLVQFDSQKVTNSDIEEGSGVDGFTKKTCTQ